MRLVVALALLVPLSAAGCTEAGTTRARISATEGTLGEDLAHVDGSFVLEVSSGSESTEVWLYGADVLDKSAGAPVGHAVFDTDASFPLELRPFSSAEARIRFRADTGIPEATGLAAFCASASGVSIRATLYDSAADTGGESTGFSQVAGPVAPLKREGAPPDATQFHATWSRELGGGPLINSARGADGSVVVASNAGGGASLSRLEAGGDLAWNRALLSATEPRVAAGGDVVVVGDNFVGTIEVLDVPLTTASGLDFYLARVDAAGSAVWARSLGGLLDQRLRNLSVGPDGGVLVLVVGGADLGDGVESDGDLTLGKLDADGKPLFARALEATNAPSSLMVPTPSGGVILGGVLGGGESFGLGGGELGRSGSAIWIGELDGMGIHLWSRSFEAPGPVGLTAVALGPDGRLVVSGWVTIDAADELGVESPGNFVAALDPGGTPIWTHWLGPLDSGEISDVIVDASSHTFVTGSLLLPADLGGGVLDNAGAQMEYLLELDPEGEHVRSELLACAGDGGFARRSEPTTDLVLAGDFLVAAAAGAGVMLAPSASYVARFPGP